jgi:hypothetical protein
MGTTAKDEMTGRKGEGGRGWGGGSKSWTGAEEANLVMLNGRRDYRVGSFWGNEPEQKTHQQDDVVMEVGGEESGAGNG